MAKMAATGITEPAAGLLQPLKLALSCCTIPYAFPQELKDSIPLDGCIQNYDSAYHIIFTNVKTIQQSVPERAGACRQWITLVASGRDCEAAYVASRLLHGRRRGRGLFSVELTPSCHGLARASVAQKLHSLASVDALQPRSEPFLPPPSPTVRAYPAACRLRKP